MSSQIQEITKHVNGLSPVDIPTDQSIGKHIVSKLVAMNQVSESVAVAYYEREKDNFMKRINDSEDLSKCTPMSIFFAFMQGFGWGLSFDGGEQSEIYLIPGNKNTAAKNAPAVWVKECVAQPSPYGKKKIRVQTGQIRGTSDPVIVYKGDKYREYTDPNTGKLMVEWEKGDRGEKPVIVSSFIRIDKADGTFEFVTFDMEDVKSWQASSAKKNSKWEDRNGQKVKVDGKTNVLYTSNNGQIDKKFFEGKTLTHAFKGYPKVVKSTPVPEQFVPSGNAATVQGFDMDEYTEDASYTEEKPVSPEVANLDDQLAHTEVTETVTFEASADEPTF